MCANSKIKRYFFCGRCRVMSRAADAVVTNTVYVQIPLACSLCHDIALGLFTNSVHAEPATSPCWILHTVCSFARPSPLQSELEAYCWQFESCSFVISRLNVGLMLVDGFAPRACGIYEVWVPLLLCYVFFSACSTMLWPRTRTTRRAWKSSDWRETDHDSQSPQARMSNFIWVTDALVLASFSLHGQCRRRFLFWFHRSFINWSCLNNWCRVPPINWNFPDKWSRRMSYQLEVSWKLFWQAVY